MLNMAHTAITRFIQIIVILGILIPSFGQTNTKLGFTFKSPDYRQNLSMYLETNVHDQEVPTASLFIFKINGNGKISDLYFDGNLDTLNVQIVKSNITKSATFWKTTGNQKDFRWIVYPFFTGNSDGINQQTGFDFFRRTEYLFFEIEKRFNTGLENVIFIHPRTSRFGKRQTL